jgi:hypothetical protein
VSIGVAEPLEVWLLIVVNFLGFILGTVITGISYYAYRMGDGKTSLRNATVGFGLITLGVAIEPIYQLGIEGTYVLASEQNVTLQAIEGTILSLGFLVLFFSIYRYRPRSRRQKISVDGVNDELFEESK